MENKKTFRFSAEEEHTQFEKTKVQPTKLFDLDELDLPPADIDPELEALSTDDLQYKLEFEDLTREEIAQIKAILKNRE